MEDRINAGQHGRIAESALASLAGYVAFQLAEPDTAALTPAGAAEVTAAVRIISGMLAPAPTRPRCCPRPTPVALEPDRRPVPEEFARRGWGTDPWYWTIVCASCGGSLVTLIEPNERLDDEEAYLGRVRPCPAAREALAALGEVGPRRRGARRRRRHR